MKSYHEAQDKGLKSHQMKEEIKALTETLKKQKPETFVEISTHRGGAAYIISREVDSIKTHICVEKDCKIKEDKLTGNTETDFHFIYGDHTYEGVSRDYHNYRTYTDTLIFHDIKEEPEVCRHNDNFVPHGLGVVNK